MPIFSRLIFASPVGAPAAAFMMPTAENSRFTPGEIRKKEKARRAGTRGETYGYWYLRCHGYIFVAKNYMPAGAKGRTRFGRPRRRNSRICRNPHAHRPDDSYALPALSELSVTHSKQAVLVRTAQRFSSDCRLRDCPTRFDALAIDNIPGQSPVVRLHKDAFSPQLHR